jgi:hypothetical protein
VWELEIRSHAPGLVELYEKHYHDHLKPMMDFRDQTLRNARLLTPEPETGCPKYDRYVLLIRTMAKEATAARAAIP